MNIKKILTVCLTFVLVLSMLSGCTLTSKSSLPNKIDADGRFIFSIVRAEKSSAAVESTAKNLRNAFKENFDCKVTIVKDNVIEDSKENYEILIGNTNRAASTEALNVLINNRPNNAFDFIIKVIGRKVCIQATSEDMISVAGKWFVETFCKDPESWSLLKEGYEFIYAPDNASVNNTVAGVNLGLFTLVKPLEMSFVIGYEAEKILKFYSNNGITMTYHDDIDAEETNEILIGNTSREESKSVTVEGDNYCIKVVGNKLVIKGGTDLATYRAVMHFNSLLESSKTDGYFNWTDGYVINGKYDSEEDDVYTLNFVDEFEGSNIDLSVWGDYNSQEYRPFDSAIGGVSYLSTPANTCAAYTERYNKPIPQKLAYQADGKMVLAGMKISEKDFMAVTASTYNSMLFKYGIWEVRAKLSPSPMATGMWSNGAGIDGLRSRYGDIRRSCMTEIDLVENFGYTDNFHSNIHRWWDGYDSTGQNIGSVHNSMDAVPLYNVEGNNKHYVLDVERYGGKDLTQDYHTYTLYWDNESMKFAFDGKTYCTYNYSDQMSVSVHNLLNYLIFSMQFSEAGYGMAFKEGEHPEYCEAFFDSVKIYQTSAINSQMVRGAGDGQEIGEMKVLYPENPLKHSN